MCVCVCIYMIASMTIFGCSINSGVLDKSVPHPSSTSPLSLLCDPLLSSYSLYTERERI